MRKGRLHLHPITTPVIQVASGGQTAKETLITLGIGVMRDQKIKRNSITDGQ